jgi:hypothetical protein
MEEVAPSQAHFCTEVIIGTTFCADHGTKCRREDCARKYGTDISYLHLYTDARPRAAQVSEHVPDGWYKIQTSIRPTGH